MSILSQFEANFSAPWTSPVASVLLRHAQTRIVLGPSAHLSTSPSPNPRKMETLRRSSVVILTSSSSRERAKYPGWGYSGGSQWEHLASREFTHPCRSLESSIDKVQRKIAGNAVDVALQGPHSFISSLIHSCPTINLHTVICTR